MSNKRFIGFWRANYTKMQSYHCLELSACKLYTFVVMSLEVQNTPEEASRSKLIPALYVIGGVLLALVLGGLVIAGLMYVAGNFALEVEVIRDLFIIALALEACVFGIVLIIMLVMMVRLVNTVEFEIKPILEKTNNLVGTAQGTTEFVSQNLVQPTIRAKGYVAGVRAGTKALFGDPKRNLPK